MTVVIRYYNLDKAFYILIFLFISKNLRINHQITTSPVRLIDEEANQLGVVDLSKALSLARERGLDLVEVSPLASPPVCKIQDFGKYKYYQSKIEHKHKKKQKAQEVKEVRISPRIGDHDLSVKAGQARKFLSKGDKVKINLMFKGREIQHLDIGKEKIQQFSEILKDCAEKDSEIKRQENTLFLVLKPLTSENAKNENT